MKILFLGQIGHGQTSRMRMRALQRLGHTVQGVETNAGWHRAPWISRQLQRRLERGPIIDSMNAAVLSAAAEFRPDLVWAEKQEFLTAATVAALQKAGARCLHFTPDPYFTLTWKRTAIMDHAIAAFDVLVYCKSYEKGAYDALGRPSVYMPLGYCDETHRPFPTTDARWQCAIGFLGGWEPRRESFIGSLLARGADVKIWGGYWDFLRDGKWTLRRAVILRQLAGGEPFSIHRHAALAASWQGGEVYGDDYAAALTGSRIGLGFLRKVCPDQHTTRTFEIPAAGSMLLADRTAEHQEFFREGVEADYFDSAEELADKASFYAAHDDARRRVAAAGLARCESGGYSYLHRLRSVLGQLARLGLAPC